MKGDDPRILRIIEDPDASIDDKIEMLNDLGDLDPDLVDEISGWYSMLELQRTA